MSDQPKPKKDPSQSPINEDQQIILDILHYLDLLRCTGSRMEQINASLSESNAHATLMQIRKHEVILLTESFLKRLDDLTQTLKNYLGKG